MSALTGTLKTAPPTAISSAHALHRSMRRRTRQLSVPYPAANEARRILLVAPDPEFANVETLGSCPLSLPFCDGSRRGSDQLNGRSGASAEPCAFETRTCFPRKTRRFGVKPRGTS